MRLRPDVVAGPVQYVRRSIYRKLLLSFSGIMALTVAVIGTDSYIQTSGNVKGQTIVNMERMSEQAGTALTSYMSTVKSFAWNHFGDSRFQQFVMHMGTDPDSMSYYQNVFNEFV